MNKVRKSVVGALFIGGILPAIADAQSSVTLYGMINDGIRYINNTGGSSQYSLHSADAPRWGMRGVEDLGGGYRSLFGLEGGFNSSTGATGNGGAIFGRKAYVGISSPYGTVTMGRQYTSILDWTEPFVANESWGGVVGVYANDVDDTDGDIHLNNSVKYKSPNLHGFSFGGGYSFGGVAGGFSTNSAWGVGGSYLSDVFGAGGAYQHIVNPAAVSGFANSSSFTNIIYGNALAAARSQDIAAGGAYYNIGPVNMQLLVSNVTFSSPNGEQLLSVRNYQVDASYYITPALLVGGMYVFTQNKDELANSKSAFNQVAAVTDYFLSKTTHLFLMAGWQRAGGATHQAQLSGTASSNNHQILLTAGIYKRF